MKRLTVFSLLVLLGLVSLRLLPTQVARASASRVSPASSAASQVAPASPAAPSATAAPGPGALGRIWLFPHGRTEGEVIAQASTSSSTDTAVTDATGWATRAIADSHSPTPRDLQPMLDRIRVSGVNLVEIPVGYWRVDRTLVIRANTTLRGTDARRSCLVVTRPDMDLLTVSGSHITVENLCLIGPGGIAADGGNGPGRGIVNLNKSLSLGYLAVHGLWVTAFGGTAIELYGNWNARLNDVSIRANSITLVGGHGIYAGFIDGGELAANVVVDSALGGLVKGDGAIDAEGGTHLTIDNNRVDGNLAAGIQGNNLLWSAVTNNVASHTHSGRGFSLWNCSHVTVSGNLAEANDEEGFYWSMLDWLPPGGGAFLVVNNNSAVDNGLSGFYLARHSNVDFNNNLALDNNQRDAGHSGLLLHYSNKHVVVSANIFVNSHPGRGQQFGISADASTVDLSIDQTNTFVRMRLEAVQAPFAVRK